MNNLAMKEACMGSLRSGPRNAEGARDEAEAKLKEAEERFRCALGELAAATAQNAMLRELVVDLLLNSRKQAS